MKTKISVFITAVVLLLLGITNAIAQGTNAYFKKNGATIFQSPIADIDSIVFKPEAKAAPEIGYLDVDWNTNVITDYNENTGTINIQCQGTMPSFGENRVIVLPQEYEYDIRVIEDTTILSNNVTLQTTQGNMCNLFMDTNFTLSTDPSLSFTSSLRSSGNSNVITPSEIWIMTTAGYKKIYDKSSLMRAASDISYNIFSFTEDFSGTDLYNQNGQRVYWDKGIFDIGLKGVFSFDFGQTVVNKIHWGELKKFEYYLDGNLNIDLLLKYVFSTQFKESKENLLKENIIPEIKFKFVVGEVPVFITVRTDLYSRYDLGASAEITMSAGCNLQANARMGLTYIPDAGVSPITSFTPSFTLHEPAFTAQGSLMAKGSIYPRIKIAIYKFAAPWVEPIPYLREDFEGGMRVSTDGNNYLGWTSKSYAGLDCRMGLNFDFVVFNKNVWTSDIYNLKDALLFDAPKKIELSSPANGTKVTAGQSIDVSFYISSLNTITGNYSPCLGALVNFSTQGDINTLVAVSDMSGSATVQWTPKEDNDRLTAEIVDKDGQTISEATFTSTYSEDNCQDFDNPQGVVINGVRWATRNVGAQGTFASSPCDYGGYYSMNEAEYICPVGWRLPTLAEQKTLIDVNKVTFEWTYQNGVAGGKFTDKDTNNTLFLPATGTCDYTGMISNIGSLARYRSSTYSQYGIDTTTYYGAYCLSIGNNPIDCWVFAEDLNSKFSIRAVAE